MVTSAIGERNHLQNHNEEKLAEFQQLRSDRDRRDWLAAFLLDPESGGCSGSNYTVRETSSKGHEKEVWVTEAIMAGPKYMNSADHAHIAIKSMTSRPHKLNAALRQAGIKEYKLTEEFIELIKGTTSGAEVRQKLDLEADDYNAVKN